MLTENQRTKIKQLGHAGMVSLMNSQPPLSKCFVDYTINNYGERVNNSAVIDWQDCTIGQILTAEPIKIAPNLWDNMQYLNNN